MKLINLITEVSLCNISLWLFFKIEVLELFASFIWNFNSSSWCDKFFVCHVCESIDCHIKLRSIFTSFNVPGIMVNNSFVIVGKYLIFSIELLLSLISFPELCNELQVLSKDFWIFFFDSEEFVLVWLHFIIVGKVTSNWQESSGYSSLHKWRRFGINLILVLEIELVISSCFHVDFTFLWHTNFLSILFYFITVLWLSRPPKGGSRVGRGRSISFYRVAGFM